jgi:hypothetical protein
MNRHKGDKNERECKNLLKEAGWTVHKKTNNKYDNGDIFGLIDVIATKKDKKPLYIQVKTNTTAGAMKKLSEAQFMNKKHMNIQVWVRHDRKGWRIKKLGEEGWKQPLDERENNSNIGREVVELYSQQTF